MRIGFVDRCETDGVLDDTEALMKRSVLMLLLVAVAFLVVDRVEGQTGGPTFTVENPRIDVGEVNAGDEAVATFVFHNEGDVDVKILKAKPS